jgi:general secretion pathway protein N
VRTLLWVVVAALCLIAAVIARAPATLIDARVAAATGNGVRVTDAQGTIWDGAGTVRLAGASSGQPLAWRADPTSIVSGAVDVALGPAPGAPRPATLKWSPSRVEIRQLDSIEVPVDAVARALAPGVPAPIGTLRIAIPQLAIDATSVAGQVRLAWQGAALPDATTGVALRLGTVTAELGDANGALTGPVRGSGGEVDVAGTLAWRPPGRLAIELTLTPRAGLPSERQEGIASTLARYGRPDGRGGFRIANSGPPQ